MIPKESREFMANKAYIADFGDDLTVASWIEKEPLTPPFTLWEDAKIITQGYSGYLFHSFNSERNYDIQLDYLDVQAYGMGTWALFETEQYLTIHNISWLLRVGNEHVETYLLPAQQITIYRKDWETTDVQETDIRFLDETFRSNSLIIDDTTWRWFQWNIAEKYTLFTYEYNSWKEKESISDVDIGFTPSSFLFFNKRKTSLVQAQEIFWKLQKVIRSQNCPIGGCGENTVIKEIEKLRDHHPDVADEITQVIYSYYQRHLVKKMSERTHDQVDSFDFTAWLISSSAPHFQNAMKWISIWYDQRIWIDTEKNGKNIDRVIARTQTDYLNNKEKEAFWSFIQKHILDSDEASEYTLELVQKYILLGEQIRLHTTQNQEDILNGYINVLEVIKDQISHSYFTKEGILYQVKPHLIQDTDEDLDFDIINDFTELFATLESIFADGKQNIWLDIDKEQELTKILARLRWFECIFVKNPEYLKLPKVCRGKLTK